MENILLFFFNHVYSHTLRKAPDVNNGELDNIFDGDRVPCVVAQNYVDQAKAILEVASRLIEDEFLYTRVDTLIVENELMLMELELIEPALYMGPETAQNFVNAIIDKIGV